MFSKRGLAEQATEDNMIRRMRFSCRVPKATHTYSKYVMPVAFARKQQWLRLYVRCLSVCFCGPRSATSEVGN